MSKPRIVKNYDKLTPAIQAELRAKYPYGFDKDIIRFKNHKGRFVSALPYEAEDFYYLVRMTVEQAHEIRRQEDQKEVNIDINSVMDLEEVEDDSLVEK